MNNTTIEELRKFLETLYYANSSEGIFNSNEAAIQVMIMCNEIERNLKESLIKQNKDSINSPTQMLIEFIDFISKTPQAELEFYSNEELLDGFLKKQIAVDVCCVMGCNEKIDSNSKIYCTKHYSCLY